MADAIGRGGAVGPVARARGVATLWASVDPSEYDVDDFPRWPGAVLATHVVARCTMAGSFFGGLGASVAWARSGGHDSLLRRAWPTWALRGAGVGALCGAAMVAGKAATLEQDDVDDRAYRLLHNEGQTAVDTWATAGCVAVAAAGAATYAHPSVLMRVSQGGAVGVSVGVVAYLFAGAAQRMLA